MDTHRTLEEFQAALTRLIEGEAEPHDDLLVAEMLRAHPELRAQLRRQLELDALLRLEAEPTADAFVESVATRTQPATADADAFLQRVTAALPKSSEEPAHGHSFRGSWFSWRPLAAAAAGIALGMFCTSVVFAYVSPRLSKAMTLLAESFESIPAPQAGGVPTATGNWSGDFAEIVGPQNGVTPHSGGKMWRFLRADNALGEDAPASYVGEAIHVIDLKPLRSAGAKPGSQLEISAWFAAGAVARDFRCHWNIKAAAFEGEATNAPTLWQKWDQASTSLAQREIVAEPGGRWQRVSVTMLLPMNADFLVFECAAVQRKPAVVQGVAEFPAHYVDNVRVRLIPPAGSALVAE